MTSKVSDFIPGSLEYTDGCIEVADGHHVTAKQKGQVQIRMCNDNRDTLIAKFHNVLLAPDLRNRLFYNIKLMTLVQTCLFHKEFCTVYFVNKEKNAINLPQSEQQKHALLGKLKQISKSKKIAPKKKVALRFFASDIRTHIY